MLRLNIQDVPLLQLLASLGQSSKDAIQQLFAFQHNPKHPPLRRH